MSSDQAQVRERLWDGVSNVRDLGGLPLPGGGSTAFGVALRADNVNNLTASGRQALIDAGVRRIVDLRWEEELSEDVGEKSGSEIVHVPLLGRHRPESRYVRFATIAADVEDESAFTRRLYGEYMDEFRREVAAAVAAIAEAPGTTLFHCTAGKDRTGIVAAVILRLSGVAIEDVAADYALTDVSGLLKRGLVDGMSEEEVRSRRFLLSAPYEGMLQVLRDLDERYGSVSTYLEQAGLASAAARTLRARLTATSY